MKPTRGKGKIYLSGFWAYKMSEKYHDTSGSLRENAFAPCEIILQVLILVIHFTLISYLLTLAVRRMDN